VRAERIVRGDPRETSVHERDQLVENVHAAQFAVVAGGVDDAHDGVLHFGPFSRSFLRRHRIRLDDLTAGSAALQER